MTQPNGPTVEWVDPTGVVWNLSDPENLPYWVLPGIKGLGAIPVAHTTSPRSRGGVTVRHTQPQSRRITLGIYTEASDGVHDTHVGLWRQLGIAITSTRYRGPGQLRITRPDGSARQIDCLYEAGWDSEDADLGIVQDVAVVTLLCPTPEWRDVDEVTVTNQYTSGSVSYYSPYLSVASSLALGQTTISNAGGVDAWPSWTITGPASSITATNHTTGESWTLNPNASAIGHGDLVGGETVTVVTDPSAVTGPDGSDWYGALGWGSVLWRLVPGDNEIEYNVTAAASGTSLTMAFTPRYETA